MYIVALLQSIKNHCDIYKTLQCYYDINYTIILSCVNETIKEVNYYQPKVNDFIIVYKLGIQYQ